jgi:hypothetical protein
MGRKKEFVAIARHQKSWWVASVPEIEGVHARARRLEELPARVIDAIRVATDLPKSSIGVDIEWKLSRQDSALVSAALASMERAEEAAQKSRESAAKAATALAREGFSVRDIGHLLGLTPQRITRILRVG